MLHTKESKNKCGKKINWEKNQAQPQLDGAKQQGDEISLMCSLLLKRFLYQHPIYFVEIGRYMVVNCVKIVLQIIFAINNHVKSIAPKSFTEKFNCEKNQIFFHN